MSALIDTIHAITELEEKLTTDELKLFRQLVKTTDFKIRHNLPVLENEFRQLTEILARVSE